MKNLFALIGALLTALAMNASAAVINLSGSNVGAADLYDGYPAYRLDFNISGDGIYSFETLDASFDTFIELYPAGLSLPAATFDPLAFDDDGSAQACGDFFCSAIIDLPLGAGGYSLFVRGSSGEVGRFDLRLTTVQGPELLLVPEPAGLAALGLGLLLLTRSRRAGRPARAFAR